MATLRQDSKAHTARAAFPVPKWWTKGYSALLAGMVAANLLVDCPAFRIIDGGPFTGLAIGLLLAQLFLMGLWLALGGLRFVVRFALVTIVTLLGTFAATIGMDSTTPAETIRLLAVVGGVIVLGTQATLLPFRWLLGWRVDFDRAYHAGTGYRSMQFGSIHLLGLTTAWALPLALVQFFPPDTTGEAEIVLLALGVIGLVGSFPVAMFAVATRRQWAWGLITVGTFPLASFVESMAMGLLLGNEPWIMWEVNAGIAAVVFLNLGVLRLVGLRLFSVKQPAPQPSLTLVTTYRSGFGGARRCLAGVARLDAADDHDHGTLDTRWVTQVQRPLPARLACEGA